MNGFDKNFVRLCAAINGFHTAHGTWPTRVRLFAGALADLRDFIFSSESFQALTEKIEQVVDDDAPMVAEDDEGNSYNYGEQGFPDRRPQPSAEEWLGVQPDGPAMHSDH